MNLSLNGFSCTLYKDDIIAKEINRGAHLVPYNGDKGIMLDRFDCRGYMNDLRNYETKYDDIVFSHEEWETEHSCDYERYFDIYHNTEPSDIKNHLDKTDPRPGSTSGTNFSAVQYVYTSNTSDDKSDQSVEGTDNLDISETCNDVEYICPPTLLLPSGMISPATEREAAIIEQTARFVAEKGAQLEILIKTKQADNSRFTFLNYDHKLHPFYRYITHLIKSAQYVPAKRHTSHLVQSNDEVLEKPMSSCEPIAPKVDISSTPYGKLIEIFKQSQERKRENKIEQVLQDILQPINGVSGKGNCDNAANKREPSPEAPEVVEARQRMYQELYHQYFPYYFQYCKETYGNFKPHEAITELARDYAASSAAAWIQSNISETALITQKEEEEDRLMKKMAEYVAKNGEELEQIMLDRNKDRFDFLLPEHTHYKKYKRFLAAELLILHPESTTTCEPLEQTIDCIIDSYGSHSPPHNEHNGPISFKMTSKQKASKIMKESTVEDLEDDFDFADQLISKSKSSKAGLSQSKKVHRVSRFSPANPKNIEIIAAALNTDLQTQRKRRAEEFLASISANKRAHNTEESIS